MDLTAVQNLVTGQGPLFWGAAAAAALGASLLVAALVMRVGRGRARRRFSLPRRPRRKPVAAAPAMARAVPGGYAPAVPGGHGSTRGGQNEMPGADFGPALARLRRAADRLASLSDADADSRLKGAGGGVDLLSRRGVG